MSDMTVVYYTANMEDESFENKIKDNLVKSVNGRLPIISVSQKPINLGKNICVGEVGCHDWNAFRQLRIGIEEAKTRFICAAESDVLYPPEYFDFEPPTNGCYHYNNCYILWRWVGKMYGNRFHNKAFSEGAQYCSKDYWLFQLDRVMKDGPMWVEPGTTIQKINVFGKYGFERSEGGFANRENCPVPVISIKTGNGLRNRTKVAGGSAVEELPYWGKAHDLRIKLFGNCHEVCDCKVVGEN